MDDTELHYVTYDPDEIMQEMMVAYLNAGGDLLYAGDEKEMLLRAFLDVMVQAFAGVDNACRMATLRYAVRDYLDVYGEKRGCVRIEAKPATATVKVTAQATGVSRTIEAGSILTADGVVMYKTTEDMILSGNAQELSVEVECTKSGSIGNGLLNGTQMQFTPPVDGVPSVVCTASATGGQDEEEDEAYRERIRTYGLTTVTTGPSSQYESVAMSVSSNIVDAKALKLSAGQVGVYLILSTQTGSTAILDAVEEALNGEDTRPLTDTVTVAQATAVPYTLVIQYQADAGSDVSAAFAAAVSEYQEWQDNKIGRAFNPDKLIAMLYQAGATRAVIGSGSSFNGGTAEYTEIAESARCSGTISLAVMT